MARKAYSTETLLRQVDIEYPRRKKTSDGWIGDAAHRARKSDHNPNKAGVVQALDLTHDPDHGFDAGKFARMLIDKRDRRIKYIISNKEIAFSTDWKWKNYSGANAHTLHCHVSVSDNPALYDDARNWIIDPFDKPVIPATPPAADIPKPIKNTYPEALRRLLIEEGGYVNNPSDKGGPTNYGITIHDYRKYINPRGTAKDVRNMTVDQAKAIYRPKYWNAMNCDALPAGVDNCVFDYGVNSGIGRAPKVLQRIVGVADDGAIGPITLTAVWKNDPIEIVNKMCDERMIYLRSLGIWRVFGKGWTARVARVRSTSVAMAEGHNVAAAMVLDGTSGVSKEVEYVPQAKEDVDPPTLSWLEWFKAQR